MKDARIEFRISNAKKDEIMNLAKSCNMSVGNYIEQCIFNNKGKSPEPMLKTENLLLHLGNISDLVNAIDCTQSVKNDLQKEVLQLWAVFKVVNPKWNPLDDQLIPNEIHYILRKDKIKSGYYGGNNIVLTENPDDIISQFQIPAIYFNKQGCVLLRHFVLSFDRFYECYITPEIIYKIAQRLSMMVLSGLFGGYYQAVFAVHEDVENFHAHFLVNTVDLCTGKILTISPSGFKQILKDVELQMTIECRQLGVFVPVLYSLKE